MKLPPLGLLLAATLLAGCETTGDPTRGGLFGWSEAKADQRIDDRQAALAQSGSERERERSTEGSLRRTQARQRSELAVARPTPSLQAPSDAETKRAQLATLSRLAGEASRLEADSPTPAGASRARRLRAAIERLRNDSALTVEQRAAGIAEVQAGIDRSRLGVQ